MNEEDIEFKNALSGLDYINSLESKVREIFLNELRIVATALLKPKITYEELLGLPLEDFLLIINKFLDSIGDKRKDMKRVIKNNPFEKVTYRFPPMSKISSVKEE